MDAELFRRLIQEELNKAITPVVEELSNIKDRLSNVEDRLSKVEVQGRITTAKMANAGIGRDQALTVVPLDDGTNPQVEIPSTISHLLVAGNEILPNGQHNNWNKRKSLALLRAYDPQYETDDESDNEVSQRSQNRRLRVAKVLGVTKQQLNFAQMNL